MGVESNVIFGKTHYIYFFIFWSVYGTVGLPAKRASLWVSGGVEGSKIVDSESLLKKAAEHPHIVGIEIGLDLASSDLGILELKREEQVGTVIVVWVLLFREVSFLYFMISSCTHTHDFGHTNVNQHAPGHTCLCSCDRCSCELTRIFTFLPFAVVVFTY